MTIKDMNELPELLEKLKFGKIDKGEFDRLSALIAIIVNCPTKTTKQVLAKRFIIADIQQQPKWFQIGQELEMGGDNCRVLAANYLAQIDLRNLRSTMVTTTGSFLPFLPWKF